MTQQGKAGIFLLALLALFLVSYLVFSTKNEVINFEEKSDRRLPNDNQNQLEKLSQAEIEANYKSNLKKAFNDFEGKIAELGIAPILGSEQTATYASNTQAVTEELTNFKVGLMELTVPGEFKELHFSLVKALSEQKEEIMKAGQIDNDELLAIIAQPKERYDWLK
jgi:hypothetical protein